MFTYTSTRIKDASCLAYLRPWRWRQNVLPKSISIPTCAISQKITDCSQWPLCERQFQHAAIPRQLLCPVCMAGQTNQSHQELRAVGFFIRQASQRKGSVSIYSEAYFILCELLRCKQDRHDSGLRAGCCSPLGWFNSYILNKEDEEGGLDSVGSGYRPVAIMKCCECLE
jgi:hypothetical protein